ncbi:MAG: TonB family protein [Deltaproteobacteria bacterium]|jgi:protein TonB|nr:TonB family protein [Deltaproteobacteria bacterium]
MKSHDQPAAFGKMPKTVSQSRLGLGACLLASLLSHAALLGLWLATGLLWALSGSAAPGQQSLRLDLYGLISDRQLEEIAAEPGPLEPEPEALVEPEAVPIAELEPIPEPVVIPEAEAIIEPNPEPQAKPKMAPRPQTAPRPQRAPQAGQTVSHREVEASLTRRYVSDLSRKIRARLIYPAQAKSQGMTGVVTVSFMVTESGGLRSGSESIRSGSGYRELDEAALKAVRAAAPFPKPPKAMVITLSVNFKEKARGG